KCSLPRDMDLGPPDVLERKGALTLRSHCDAPGAIPGLCEHMCVSAKCLGEKTPTPHLGTSLLLGVQTGLPQTGVGAVLPRHPSDHFKMLVGPQTGDYSIVHRKCHSQFTDTADYRRHGINTWQDESGIYANADIKQKVFPVTNPIPSNVPEDYF
uniref:Chromosome 9 open reading frame 135 n=1 Tax=Pelusios castaneus TaxID=367368 RepID=A0A8C8RFP6_9SAUR